MVRTVCKERPFFFSICSSSDFLCQLFTEQARRLDDENDDEQRKRERIGEGRQLHAFEQILADADDERADDRAGD